MQISFITCKKSPNIPLKDQETWNTFENKALEGTMDGSAQVKVQSPKVEESQMTTLNHVRLQ